MEQATFTMDLDFDERERVDGHQYKTFELAALAQATTRGSSTTQYALEPAKWLRQAMEYAKYNMVMQPLCKQEVVPAGTAQLSIPLEKIKYASWETSDEEYVTDDTQITFSAVDNLDGVIFDPKQENYAVGVSNKALRRNALSLMENYQKQMADHVSYVVDGAVYSTIRPAATVFTGTEATNSARGIQTIFGGSGTTAADTLASGAVMTTGIIKKANRLLKSHKLYYWTGDVWTKSAMLKNPWKNDGRGPFYGIISPESEENLLNSSQFTNACEMGDQSVIKSGTIGTYMGIRFHQTNMLQGIASGGNVYVQGGNTRVAADASENYFLVANNFAGLVWGLKPKFYAFDYPSSLQKRIVVEMAYQAKVLYPDAMVRAVTADE